MITVKVRSAKKKNHRQEATVHQSPTKQPHCRSARPSLVETLSLPRFQPPRQSSTPQPSGCPHRLHRQAKKKNIVRHLFPPQSQRQSTIAAHTTTAPLQPAAINQARTCDPHLGPATSTHGKVLYPGAQVVQSQPREQGPQMTGAENASGFGIRRGPVARNDSASPTSARAECEHSFIHSSIVVTDPGQVFIPSSASRPYVSHSIAAASRSKP